jgi:hypothetical protein
MGVAGVALQYPASNMEYGFVLENAGWASNFWRIFFCQHDDKPLALFCVFHVFLETKPVEQWYFFVSITTSEDLYWFISHNDREPASKSVKVVYRIPPVIRSLVCWNSNQLVAEPIPIHTIIGGCWWLTNPYQNIICGSHWRLIKLFMIVTRWWSPVTRRVLLM